MLKWNTTYRDGSKREGNKFEDINKDKLKKFILGDCSYDTDTGVFSIDGAEFSCYYREEDGTEYKFCNRDTVYNDLIHYNKAEAIQGVGSQVLSQNFGYKITYDIKGIQFHFKPILSLTREGLFMTVYIKPSEALRGSLVIDFGDNESAVEFDLEKNGDNEITLELEVG